MNWKVWQTCARLVGRDNKYNTENKVYNWKVIRALRWLIKNNVLYNEIEYPQAPLEMFYESAQNLYGNSKGEVFTVKAHLESEIAEDDVFTTLRTVDEDNLGTDDSKFSVIPVGETIMNGVKKVFSLAYSNIDAHLFPFIYPTGKNSISNRQAKRARIVRDRLFHANPIFRNCSEWYFYHFDVMEKNRLVDNNARTTL